MVKISDAELEIMNIIWKEKELNASEIMKKLTKNIWKINTVRTMLNRLIEKGVIEKKIKNNVYYYFPKIEKNAYRDYATDEFMKKYYNNSIETLIKECLKNKLIKKDELKKLIV